MLREKSNRYKAFTLPSNMKVDGHLQCSTDMMLYILPRENILNKLNNIQKLYSNIQSTLYFQVKQYHTPGRRLSVHHKLL